MKRVWSGGSEMDLQGPADIVPNGLSTLRKPRAASNRMREPYCLLEWVGLVNSTVLSTEPYAGYGETAIGYTHVG